jgi:hypothetical protein
MRFVIGPGDNCLFIHAGYSRFIPAAGNHGLFIDTGSNLQLIQLAINTCQSYLGRLEIPKL